MKKPRNKKPNRETKKRRNQTRNQEATTEKPQSKKKIFFLFFFFFSFFWFIPCALLYRYVWTRRFAAANATIDVKAGTGVLTLASGNVIHARR